MMVSVVIYRTKYDAMEIWRTVLGGNNGGNI